MGFFRKFKAIASLVVEKINLKTARDLKGDLASMPDEELLAKRGSTVRSVSSSVLGFAINVTMSIICPPYAVVAAINAVQIGVSSTNTHRVRKEIKKRKSRDPKFEALAKANSHVLRDICIGVGVKTALSVISLGLVGGGEVLNHFHDFALQHPLHQATGNLAGDYIAQNVADYTTTAVMSVDGGHHDAPGKDWVKLNEFKAENPTAVGADLILHRVTSGLSDQVLNHTGPDGIKIDDNTSWADLQAMAVDHDKTLLATRVVEDGVASEGIQPAQQTAEYLVEKSLDHKEIKKIEAQKVQNDVINELRRRFKQGGSQG